MKTSMKELIATLHANLHGKGKDIITLSWPQFYKLCGRSTLPAQWLDFIKSDLSNAGMIIAYGSNVVMISKDTNHSPVAIGGH